MTSRSDLLNKTTPVICLALASLFLVSCYNVVNPMINPVRGLQFNNIAQENAERAAYSADFAQQQTCPAATPYRTQSRIKANQAQALAEESAQLTEQISTLLEQRGTILGFVQSSQQRLDDAMQALAEANTEFMSVHAQGDSARLRDLIPAMNNLQQASHEYSRQLLAVADEFDAMTANPDNQNIFEGLFADPSAVATDFRIKAEQLQGDIQLAGEQEYSVPENPRSPEDYEDPDDWVPYDGSQRLGDFKIPSGLRQDIHDYTDEYDSVMGVRASMWSLGNALRSDEGDFSRHTALAAFDGIKQVLSQTSDDMLSQMSANSDRIQEITDETRALSAEATRQAWLAHEACGGELPEDFPVVENPFDTRETGIPDWSSTFWDISSP